MTSIRSLSESNLAIKILAVPLMLAMPEATSAQTAIDNDRWYRSHMLEAGGVPGDLTEYGLPPFPLQGVEIFFISDAERDRQPFVTLPTGDRCAALTGQPKGLGLRHSSSFWTLELPMGADQPLKGLQVQQYHCWHPAKRNEQVSAEHFIQLQICEGHCLSKEARTLGIFSIMRGSTSIEEFEYTSRKYLRDLREIYESANKEFWDRQKQRVAQETAIQLASWRRELKPGSGVRNGMIIELKPPLAFVQICNAWLVSRSGVQECREAQTMWMRIEELQPPNP